MTVERWCSMAEICEHLNTSYYGVKLSIKYDKMPASKVGRLWRFKISEVDEWLQTPEGQNSVIGKRINNPPAEVRTKRPYQKHYVKQKEINTVVPRPTVSFKPLFKLLIDRDMKKKELAEAANISIATITKMGKDGRHINTNVLERICKALDCKFNDIIEIIPAKAVEPEVDNDAEQVVEVNEEKPVEVSPASVISRVESTETKAYGEYTLTPVEQDIAHYIYEQLQYYTENPPPFMVNAVLMTNKKEQPDMTYEEAKSTITTDKYYSLVLNEVFEKWGQQGWAFEKKHIPFDLIESGYFEDDQEETFGDITMQ